MSSALYFLFIQALTLSVNLCPFAKRTPRIENCFFKGFTLSARFDTYNYGDLKPHIIRNSIFQVTNLAATHSVRTWFGIIQNVICNKPMQNNSPYSENDIVLTDAPINVDLHGYGQVEIYPANYYTT